MGQRCSRVKVRFFNTTRKETRKSIITTEEKIVQNTSWKAIKRYFPEWDETDEIVVLIGHSVPRTNKYSWKGYVLQDPETQRYEIYVTDINISVIDNTTHLASIHRLVGFSQK